MSNSNIPTQPAQPLTGPGGQEYICDSVNFQDYAQKADGYWLFEPSDPQMDSAHLVVFLHGYGAYNPMIYGDWIEHLVRKGNIVVFPRYQKNLVSPRASKFPRNAAKAIRDAIELLNTGDHVRPITDQLTLIGHSYGGVISANLAVNFEQYQIPEPKAVMLCSPGSGPLKGARVDSYHQLSADLNLLITISEYDYVVGAEFGLLVYETATNTPHRNLLIQRQDTYGKPAISAGHNETYSFNRAYDSGSFNWTAQRAARISKLDAVDYYGYWKLADALMDFTRYGTNVEYCFGNTPEQRNLGKWSDGTPIRPLDVIVPQEIEEVKDILVQQGK
ncbi:MAG: alpha/beta hydrolase [Saprospiraceae bacterium]